MRLSHIITDQNITVNFDNKTHIISRDNRCANQIIEAIKSKDIESLQHFIDVAKRIAETSNNKFTVEDGVVMVDGEPAPRFVGDRIVDFCNQKLPYEPLLSFVSKVNKNPSFRAVNELYQFLETNNHPLTESGNFIAYKKVGNDFMDLHTHTIDNSVGNFVQVPRNKVDDNPNHTCSYGLHVANWDYAANYYGSHDDTMLEVEVDPADVVSVPVDYNKSKMRVCAYKVLGVVDRPNSVDTCLRKTDPDGLSDEEYLDSDEGDYDDDYESDDYEDNDYEDDDEDDLEEEDDGCRRADNYYDDYTERRKYNRGYDDDSPFFDDEDDSY